MLLFRLSLVIFIKVHCCFTNSIVIEVDNLNNYFPDVAYPTCTYEINEPFYFKSNIFDGAAAPFSDDVRKSYKSFTSISNKKTLRNSKAKNFENSFNEGDTLRSSATLKTYDEPVELITAKIIINNYNEENETICYVSEDIDETKNNVCLMPEEYTLLDDSCTNSTVLQEIENQNITKTPLYVKVEFEVLNSFTKNDSERDDISMNFFNKTLEKISESFKIINSSYWKQEKLKCGSSSSGESDEFNEYEFTSNLAILLVDFSNSKENTTLDDSQTQKEESIPPNSSPGESFTNAPMFNNTFPDLNYNLLTIPIEYYNMSITDTNKNFTVEIESTSYGEEKEYADGNDYFLNFVISLNNLLLDNDFHLLNISNDITVRFEPARFMQPIQENKTINEMS